MPLTCDHCGITADGDDLPLTWSTSVESRGVTRLYCERCTRENLRAMEGKLDRAFW